MAKSHPSTHSLASPSTCHTDETTLEDSITVDITDRAPSPDPDGYVATTVADAFTSRLSHERRRDVEPRVAYGFQRPQARQGPSTFKSLRRFWKDNSTQIGILLRASFDLIQVRSRCKIS